MRTIMGDASGDELHRRARAAWETNAPFWDERYGEGNDFQRVLIAPATERLLDIKADEFVLDVACGNGAFARRLAELGARVVAFDQSEAFIERARARTAEHVERITYHVLDAADAGALASLGEGRFDAAVCSMALMDMADIEPLMAAMPRLLKPGGRFVFSVMHPCFNNPEGSSNVAERVDRDGELVTQSAIKVWHYIRPSVAKGLGIVGQPVPHYYFHRPLSGLLAPAFRAGMVLDGLEEPVFPKGDMTRPFSWEATRDLPPVLVARLRALAAGAPPEIGR